MAEIIDLIAENREDAGKGASRRLRRSGKIPAIIYGAGEPARTIAFDRNSLLRQMENKSFFSSVLTVQVDGKNQAAIVKDLQRHPYKPLLTHADFLRVDKDHEIHVNVPLHFLNEETAPAIKLQGGVANHQINEVEVICLPQNLPEFLEVDMTAVEMDQVVHLSDLKLPKGVRIAALLQGEDHDLPVVAIHKPRAAKTEDTDEGEDGEAGEEGEDKE